MAEEQLIWRGVDHANRSWLVTARPGVTGPGLRPCTIVTFLCRTERGAKTLDKAAAWLKGAHWSTKRWTPSSPRPVPEAVLTAVEAKLREVAA